MYLVANCVGKTRSTTITGLWNTCMNQKMTTSNSYKTTGNTRKWQVTVRDEEQNPGGRNTKKKHLIFAVVSYFGNP